MKTFALSFTLALFACGDSEKNSEDENTQDENTQEDTEQEDTEETEDEALNGEALYFMHCQSCHGDVGQGGSEQAIAHELHHSDEDLIDVILNGDGDMAPVDVSPEEAQAIVDHMRSVF